MLINMTLNEFLNEAASSSPAPGGGSVCALAGALGAALSSMVGELSVKKDIDEETKDSIESLMLKARSLQDNLEECIDKDTESFNRVLSALKMPKGTDEEKKVRSEAVQESLKYASELPYKTALLCLDVMKIAIEMLKMGNKNAASDASVSGFLAFAALNGALYNVKINLNSIKDNEFVRDRNEKIHALAEESEELLCRIKSISAEIIG